MRKFVLILSGVFFCGLIWAQDADSVTWTKKGSWGFSFANVGLSNWAAGGQNSVALGTIFNVSTTRKTSNSTWKNQLDFALGGAKVGEQGFRKTDDAIILLSQYSKKINPAWAWGIAGIFRTQLLEGINFDTTPEEKISSFLAPGYLSINLGFDYTPNDIFSVSIAPAAGKFTFVTDQSLYTDPNDDNEILFGVREGDNIRSEFGANILTTLNVKVAENISFQSNLNFFTAYDSFGNVDTNWETLLVMKVNEWFNATFGTQLVYDDDILIQQENGNFERHIQFKHVLNLGVNFSLFTAGN